MNSTEVRRSLKSESRSFISGAFPAGVIPCGCAFMPVPDDPDAVSLSGGEARKIVPFSIRPDPNKNFILRMQQLGWKRKNNFIFTKGRMHIDFHPVNLANERTGYEVAKELLIAMFGFSEESLTG